MPGGSIAFNLKFSEAKSAFFRDDLLKRLGRAKIVPLRTYGGYVRKAARNSLKYKDGAAPEGAPPHSHLGLLKDFIYFSYDESTESVVIGPVVLNGGSADKLEALEYGGPSFMTEWSKGQKRIVDIQVSEHPFMRPAQKGADDAGVLEKAFENALEKVN